MHIPFHAAPHLDPRAKFDSKRVRLATSGNVGTVTVAVPVQVSCISWAAISPGLFSPTTSVIDREAVASRVHSTLQAAACRRVDPDT